MVLPGATGAVACRGHANAAGLSRRRRLVEGSGALLDRVERVRLEAVRLAMDPRCRLGIRRVDEAEHLAVLLVDPVVLVVDAVLPLDLEVLLVGPGHVSSLHTGDVVDVHVRGHWDGLPSSCLVAPATVSTQQIRALVTGRFASRLEAPSIRRASRCGAVALRFRSGRDRTFVLSLDDGGGLP